jgi:hypothetical protein
MQSLRRRTKPIARKHLLARKKEDLNLTAMRSLTVMLIVSCVAVMAFAQNQPSAVGQVPHMSLTVSAPLQESIYPEIYSRESSSRDMAWVRKNDSLIESFVAQFGDSVMTSITKLTGFLLPSANVRVHLVRYYPSTGSSYPVIIPIGGVRSSERIVALPTGNGQIFNLLYQISRWAVAEAAGDSRVKGSIVDHPLMRPGAWQSDNLSMLLALTLGEQFLGVDSTNAQWVSPFWRRQFVSWDACNIYLRGVWKLSAEKPLLRWLDDEPWDSDLVKSFAPPRVEVQDPTGTIADRDIPGEGILGIMLKSEEKNVYLIDKIDSTRLAFACGLRQGDRILRVGTEGSSNQLQLVGKILEGYDRGATTVYVKRANKTLPVILRPMKMEKDSAG